MKKVLCFLASFLLFINSAVARDVRFVQVTDVKYSKTNQENVLSDFVKEINREKNISFVVFTGDNIAKPSKENLEGFVSQIKKLNKPYYIVLGDKDVNKHKDLSKKQYTKYLKKHLKKYNQTSPNYVFEKNGVVFVVADGTKDVIPSTMGYFKEDVLEWVDATLDLYPKKNIVILQHFPLVMPSDKETYYTYKPQIYLDILKKHPNVKAVISGHFGVNKEQTQDGILHVSTAPLPQYRVIDILDCETKNPTIWAEIKEVK